MKTAGYHSLFLVQIIDLYLVNEGIIVNSPRACIQISFKEYIIPGGYASAPGITGLYPVYTHFFRDPGNICGFPPEFGVIVITKGKSNGLSCF